MTLDELKKELSGIDGIRIQRMSVDSHAVVRGNTYPVRGKLKSLGGVWKKWAGGWVVPLENEGLSDIDYMNGY